MTMQAKGARHLATLWQSKERCWEWWALKYGKAQPSPIHWRTGTGPWRYRPIIFHFTPFHFERWAGAMEIGLCLGKRTLYLVRHR
jgi:hypothetical protein